MHLVAEKSNAEHTPLAFQLDVPWESASPEAKSLSVERTSEDCLLVYNMIAPESGTLLYEALTSQRAWNGALFGSRSANDGLQKCQELGRQDTNPQYLRIQVSNSRTNEASRTVRKTHPLSGVASRKRARKLHGTGSIPEKKLQHRTHLDMEKMTLFLSFLIDYTNSVFLRSDIITKPSLRL